MMADQTIIYKPKLKDEKSNLKETEIRPANEKMINKRVAC